MRAGVARAAFDAVARLGLALLVSLGAGCAVGTPDADVPSARPVSAEASVPERPAAVGEGGDGAVAAIAPGPPGPTAAPARGPSGADEGAAPVLPGAPAAAASPVDPVPTETLAGFAAVYSDRLVGRRTANGERYDRRAMTAAHRTLPFGTVVRVTNPRNGRSVELRINDRGPFHPERILDLSAAAALAIGLDPRSVARIEALIVSRSQTAR